MDRLIVSIEDELRDRRWTGLLTDSVTRNSNTFAGPIIGGWMEFDR
ncbi:MAG: hypothetical protein ACOX7C_00855 [Brevefilum sp.]|jgi:hypothetical protein